MNIIDAVGRYIKDASDAHEVRRLQGRYRKWVEHTVMTRYITGKVNWQTRGTVAAEIGSGWWRCRCPYCANAQVVVKDHPFFCTDCLMAGNDGYAMEVIWPDDDMKYEIECILLARPAPENMNWFGETTGALIAENLQHGCRPGVEIVR